MKTLEELKAIREKMQSQVSMRGEDHAHTRVVVGMATCAHHLVKPGSGTWTDKQSIRYPDRLYRLMPIRANRRSTGTWQGKSYLY